MRSRLEDRLMLPGKNRVKWHKPKYNFCVYDKGENREFGGKQAKDMRKRGRWGSILSVLFWKKTERSYEEEKKKQESGKVRRQLRSTGLRSTTEERLFIAGQLKSGILSIIRYVLKSIFSSTVYCSHRGNPFTVLSKVFCDNHVCW